MSAFHCQNPNGIWPDDVLRAASLTPATGLATDYLNVFNEAIMLIGLLPDMPELLADLSAWKPRSYEDHFEQSGFQAKAFALEVYRRCEPGHKVAFDRAAKHANTMVIQAIQDLEDLIKRQKDCQTRADAAVAEIQTAITTLDGLVHGHAEPLAAHDFDILFD
jgi:hypothetical protein